MKILVIEDDAVTAHTIRLMLQTSGHSVTDVMLGEEGLDFAKTYPFDIITLDLNLPDISGYEVLKRLRVARVSTPVIILSGLAGVEDKVKGLGFGADDYLTKPFHKDELIARIHAVVRRANGLPVDEVVSGGLVVNMVEKSVERDGIPLRLTGREWTMLEILARKPGRCLSKETLVGLMYGGMDEPQTKIIDVFVCKLRKKLGRAPSGLEYIETVWGQGYRFLTDADALPVVESPSVQAA